MKIAIIGGGLIGLTSAFMLRRHGHDVVLFERRSGPGQETSFANATLLTPSMSDPWNAPGTWKVLAASLLRSGGPLQLRLKALPGLVGWGVSFLRNSRRGAFEQNMIANLTLALHSFAAFAEIEAISGIAYAQNKGGSLRLLRDPRALASAERAATALAAHGVESHILDPEQAIALEPALNAIRSGLAGAIHYPGDQAGDPHRFCVALAAAASRTGVALHYNEPVQGIVRDGARVCGVELSSGIVSADHILVAAGSFSTGLLAACGVTLPVKPAKGYSLTFPRACGFSDLGIPLVDDALHAVVAPLEHGIRVTGVAEFAGFDSTFPAARERYLRQLLHRILPELSFDPADAQPWYGFRPMSCDGVPIIGGTKISGLWVNSGHGHLGWTMAAGAADLIADLMSGEPGSISPAPYALARFGDRGGY